MNMSMVLVGKRILVLAPHTDDGEFGCGGTIAKLLEYGRAIYYAAFSTAEESLPPGFPKDTLKKEVRRATGLLGIPAKNLITYSFAVRKLSYVRQEILEELIRLKRQIQPDLVLVPSINDIHQDHHTVATECLRAFKQITILGYELPWNNITFHTQAFVTLEKRHIDTKVKALRAYRSQRHRPYASREFIWSLARTRGVQIGTGLAETFEVVRLVL